MKLIRFGTPENEKPGVILDNGDWIDTSGFGEDYDELFFENDGLARLKSWVDEKANDLPKIDKSTRLGPPLKKPSKIVCVGLNYAKHAAESGMKVPTEPVLFFKATSAIVGPNDDVIIPKNSKKTDWEVELAVVIGKKASYVEEADAMDYVAGYTLHNDYSEREFQLEKEGQWVKGKSCPGFSPVGPYLVLKEDIADVLNLSMELSVNGQKMQQGNTKFMVFKPAYVVYYLSQFMQLEAGDLISTGTPPGVGLGMNPQVYLKRGDEVVLTIEGLGSQHQKFI